MLVHEMLIDEGRDKTTETIKNIINSIFGMNWILYSHYKMMSFSNPHNFFSNL